MHENFMLNLNDETVMKCHKGQWAMAIYKWDYLEFFLLVFYMNTYRNKKNLLFIKICNLILCRRVWNHVYFQNKYVLWELLIDIALSLFLTPLRFYWRVSEIASAGLTTCPVFRSFADFTTWTIRTADDLFKLRSSYHVLLYCTSSPYRLRSTYIPKPTLLVHL